MSVATVVTEGFGTFGSTAFVVTEGFGAYGSPPSPPPPPAPGGLIDYEHYRRLGRTADQEEAERRRQRIALGLERPERPQLSPAERTKRRAALTQAGIAPLDKAAQEAAIAAEAAELAARAATAAIEAQARAAAAEQAATDRARAMERGLADEAAALLAADEDDIAAILLLMN